MKRSCKVLVLLVAIVLLSLQAEASTMQMPQLVEPYKTSNGITIEPAENPESLELPPSLIKEGRVIRGNDGDIRPEVLSILTEGEGEQETAKSMAQYNMPSVNAKAVTTAAPGSSSATAINLRNKHYRATFSAENTLHWYYVDILQSEVDKFFSLILTKLPDNADFDMYILDTSQVSYGKYTDGVGETEQYVKINMPHTGRFYIFIHSFIGTGAYDIYFGDFAKTLSLTYDVGTSILIGNSFGTQYVTSILADFYVSKAHNPVGYTNDIQGAYTSSQHVRLLEYVIGTHGRCTTYLGDVTDFYNGLPSWGGATILSGTSLVPRVTPPLPLQAGKMYPLDTTKWAAKMEVTECRNLQWEITGIKMDIAFPAMSDNIDFL